MKPLTKFEEIKSILYQLNRLINVYDERLRKIECHIWDAESHLMRIAHTLSQMDSFNKMEATQNATVQHISALVSAHKNKENPFREEQTL